MSIRLIFSIFVEVVNVATFRPFCRFFRILLMSSISISPIASIFRFLSLFDFVNFADFVEFGESTKKSHLNSVYLTFSSTVNYFLSISFISPIFCIFIFSL